jgi:signal transduction histidine kinase
MIQVFEAVIDNAIKYSGELARLHITGRRESRHVVVTFADRGIGIPEDDIKHVFNRFYRAGNAASVGSGLGLTIARSIVRRHGGTMTLHSTVDVGTNVEIRLKMPPI